jgi:hypothetical protein
MKSSDGAKDTKEAKAAKKAERAARAQRRERAQRLFNQTARAQLTDSQLTEFKAVRRLPRGPRPPVRAPP